MNNQLMLIAGEFATEGKLLNIKPFGDGHINQTYKVTTEGNAPDYILQIKNKNIFKDVPAMMGNIAKVTAHLKQKIEARGGNPLRETMTIILTRDGKLYKQDTEGEYWTMFRFIDDNVSYEVADTPELAYAGGKGIGQFQLMLADLNEPLADILPGFHNIRFRFEQWDAVLAKDLVGRKAGLTEEISWVESRRDEMLRFWKLYETGEIPTRITHNDTKINNILFDRNGQVLCVIDLDTVLSSTALNDFGDAIRSYTNTGLEDDENLENVSMNIAIFEAFAKGYLESARHFLNKTELEYLAFSARYITFEQVLRFLMDYIDGDNYYRIKSPQHNLVRTRAQYKLLQSIEAQLNKMNAIVAQYTT